MIRNDREYRITKAQAAEFEKSLSALGLDVDTKLHPKIRKAQTDAVRSQLQDLRSDIGDYEALRDGRRGVIELTSLDELPRALIEGRIAAGLTQRDLGERLGVPEQQVQRYEATDYSSASFARLVQVANAVGVKMREDVFLPQVEITERALTRRLSGAGVEGDFVRRVLLGDRDDAADDAGAVLRAAGAAHRIFGWSPTEILGGKAPLAPPRAEQAALFKVYSTAEENRTRVLAAFGRYVAQLVARATPSLRPLPLPSDAAAFRALVAARSDKTDLASVLAVLWDHGVAVVPLTESGGYHGACWRFGGRNIIVLKQRTVSDARWLHDLLHETHHAASSPEATEFAWLDDDAMPVERRNAPEEKRATRFAGDVQLQGNAEAMAQECVAAASKKADRLKAIVPRVAKAHGVSTGALANYLAWRLEMDGINWWGTAANLQEVGGDPWRVVRDFLVPRLDWSQLDRLDRDLLAKALEEGVR